MARRAIGMIAALALVGALVGTAVAPAASVKPHGKVPSNFRRHQNHWWVWYGPKSWGAAWGKYDIRISSATGKDMYAYGAAATPCARSAKRYFSYARNNAQKQYGFDPKLLRSSHYTHVGKIKKLPRSFYGTKYAYRQLNSWEGKRRNGTHVRGEANFDFAYENGYCIGAYHYYAAPVRGYRHIHHILKAISKHVVKRNL